MPTAEVEVPADDDLEWVPMALADRRELAVTRARRWARSPCEDRVSPAGIGLCRYGRGSVALALAGPMGPPGLARVRELMPTIERAGRTEVVIDLSGLTDCSPGLVRLLGRLRIRRLIDQASVEVRGAPLGVEHELLVGTRDDDPARGRPTETERP